MAILHGLWLSLNPTVPEHDPEPDSGPVSTGYLFIWGEMWRGQTAIDLQGGAVPAYPLAMTLAELANHLQTWQQQQELNLPASLQAALAGLSQATELSQAPGISPVTDASIIPTAQILTLPACSKRETTDQDQQDQLIPTYSLTPATPTEAVALYPWQVPGLLLAPELAIALLGGVPLRADPQQESILAGDLRYWSHVGRWCTDLLVRSKFLPMLRPTSATAWQPIWEPLLDSALDRGRFRQFADHMPGICRLEQPAPDPLSTETESPLHLNLPQDPGMVLKQALQQIMTAQIRTMADPELLVPLIKAGADPHLLNWLRGLGPDGTPLTESCPLVTCLENWITPLQPSLIGQNQWRVCFHLTPPPAASTSQSRPWQLEYHLQSVDHPQILISAEQIWSTAVERLVFQGQALERPQETLLLGLGLASRVYPPMETSLHQARPCFYPLAPQQVYDFLKAGAWRLEDSGFTVILPASLSQRQGWANRLGLKVQAQTGANGSSIGLASLLNFKWELSIGGQTLSKAEFDRLVALNTPLVEVNGEWIELRAQDVKAATAFFAARKNQTGLSLEDALRLSTGDTLAIEKLPVVSFEASGPLQDLLSTLTGNQTVNEIAAPEGFEGSLRPYQARGVGWLSFLEQWGLGACLADDMGLGKTVQLIAFLVHCQAEQRLTGPTLLICPTSVLGNWEREIKRFAPNLKVLLHHGSQRAQGKSFSKALKGKDIILSSYPLIHRDLSSLTSVTWQFIVLDEAQNIKNADARQSQAVRQLQAQFRIALTGTPLENRLTELWSILDFLNPGYLGPRNFFQRRFATPIERYGDTASLQTLRSLVQPFILRRLKTDRDIIQDLPEKQEMTVFCGLTPEQANLYEQTVQQSLTDIDAAEGIQRRGLILATLTKLKQICNHPSQFLKEPKLSTQQQRSAKLRRLEEMLEEAVAEGDRALVFTQFAEMGKLLQDYLSQQLGWEALFLYGSTTRPQREAMVDRFQHDPQGPRIFILSLKAGGVGLNLTRANHVFHFDRWWNPAVENQATDRVFRIGQKRNVQVHKFVCTGTLEEKIHEQIESKKALAEQVVGAGENWLTDLDTDQLRSLLVLDRKAVIDEETS
jgi:superfamily II DNA or RNA helicase